MSFKLLHTDTATRARLGCLDTDHGSIQTPIFMPVGTQAAVKAVPPNALQELIGAEIILANNYHLYLRPGAEVVASAGGLHRFMNWPKPILTDSGGYQVYSLSKLRKISEEGVVFSSHIDGSKHLFTPENVVEMQRNTGPDIQMVLDECTPYPCEHSYARKSLDLTHRWAARARRAFLDSQDRHPYRQLQFGIVQGSVYDDLRKESVERIAELDFEGNAIGGLAVGEPTEELYAFTDLCCSLLTEHKPRYLMGVGTPWNLLEAIALGVDMFDCVMPTRNARHGVLYTERGILHIKNARFKQDFGPLDPDSPCTWDQQFSRAYVRHLFAAGEVLALQIASIHNLHFYLHLMRQAREHIRNGTFAAWKNELVPRLQQPLAD
jgi:queuine tRNA-ribosyltransferase